MTRVGAQRHKGEKILVGIVVQIKTFSWDRTLWLRVYLLFREVPTGIPTVLTNESGDFPQLP